MKLDPKPVVSDPRVADLFQRVNVAVNALAEGRAFVLYGASTAMPTTGTWAIGDYVHKSDPVEAGTTPNKYVIYGWKRLTSGSANVAGTDWVEDRRLTGG